ncbi:glycosyltransferase family 2 protein [Asaia bogorensis]|uniref:glycosyltransferase family 2 protein n=1 Tax=Asaia bogorensis TaxID=91915 RepID=UPI000EFD335C|nr:glycosyltransferase family 2 protein [Asaia bogorensis]
MPTLKSSASLQTDLQGFGKLPLAVARNKGIWPEPQYQHVLVACARWEAESIAEWLTYHRSIGFDHVYLYCNDDDPGALYEAVMPFIMADKPFVTFHHFRYVGEQFQMYRHFLRHYVHETRWLMFLDVDEFVCLPGSNDIRSVSERFGAHYDAVYLNWCGYGHGGHAERPSGSILRHYRYRESGASPFTKILAKAGVVSYRLSYENPHVAIHHDLYALGAPLRACNMLGESMEGYYDNFPEHAWAFLNAESRRSRLVQAGYIAHFNIRSDQDFARRVARGCLGDFSAQTHWQNKSEEERAAYHADTNAVFDPYLSDYWSSLVNEGWQSSIVPCSAWELLSTGKRATQSSTLHEGSRDDDACRAVSGHLTGRPQHHTALEDNPWWMVDLGALSHIHQIMIFNRLDGVMERLSSFTVEVSHDRFFWTKIIDRKNGPVFGGLDGTPFNWVDQAGVVGRFVRLTIPGTQVYLQTDQIEIYGRPFSLEEFQAQQVSSRELA